MNATCRRIQDTLATEGAPALRSDDAAQRHVADCADCFAVLESLNELDETFGTLPTIDAPDETVQRLLARRTSGAPATPATGGRWFAVGWRPRHRWSLPLAGAVAATVLVLLLPLTRTAAPGLSEFEMARVESDANLLSTEEAAVLEQAKIGRVAGGRREGADGVYRDETSAIERGLVDDAVLPDIGAGQERFGDLAARPGAPPAGQMVTGGVGNFRSDAPASGPEEADGLLRGAQSRGSAQLAAGGGLSSNNERAERENAGADGDAVDAVDLDEVDTFRDGDPQARDRETIERRMVGGVAGAPVPSAESPDAVSVRVGGTTGIEPPERIAYVAPVFPDIPQNASVQGVVLVEVRIAADGQVTDARVVRSIPRLDAAAIEAVRQWKYAPPLVDGAAVPVVMTVTVNVTTEGDPEAHAPPDEPQDDSSAAARHFLDERVRIEGLLFQPPRGYWANTYVPGDPVLRRLGSTLDAAGPVRPATSVDMSGALHDASHRVKQPFDRPRDSAIAVYMASDHTAADGPRRTLVQVGLQAAPRHAGHRVAMRLAIVVDLRGPLQRDLIDSVRVVLESFAAAQGPADRFSLVAAGRDLTLSADEFRYGAINVALRDLLEADSLRPAARDLESAVRLAVRTVSAESTEASIPGAGAVVLVTGQPLGASAGPVERLAGRSAAAGIPVSVVGVGADYDLDALDRIVLAGQGSRRLLTAEADARALVERELSASSRVVAQALRVRIRLAPGVKLVDVVGSTRLGGSQAERVRETERRLDRELARSLGIASDRGEDEDGIQIVIPAFHAGDSHAILLDVVAPGPGALADVTVRYKDLVFLRNGVARATTVLQRGEDQVGPLQTNVVKNFLAHQLAGTLHRSAQLLTRQQPVAAHRTLVQAGQLLDGLRAELRGLVTDPDLRSDLSLIREYVTLLESDVTETEQAYWSRSMRFAGLLKILPRPVS